jgi:hypothetical protein
MKTKKALLIDVVNKTVSNVTVKRYQEIYDHIGNGCHLFCIPYTFENEDSLYADDEALLQDTIIGGFMLPDWHSPIIGNAIILGSDDEGESVDCKTKAATILEDIIFLDRNLANEYAALVMGRKPEIIIL